MQVRCMEERRWTGVVSCQGVGTESASRLLPRTAAWADSGPEACHIKRWERVHLLFRFEPLTPGTISCRPISVIGTIVRHIQQRRTMPEDQVHLLVNASCVYAPVLYKTACSCVSRDTIGHPKGTHHRGIAIVAPVSPLCRLTVLAVFIFVAPTVIGADERPRTPPAELLTVVTVRPEMA